MKHVFFVIVLMGLGSLVLAQDNTEEKTGSKESTSYRYTPSPDFPGALVFEYGINYFDNNSAIMDTDPWKSPTLNLYYMYAFRIGEETPFSFNIGAGVGNEKYTFKSPITFSDSLTYTIIDSLSNVPFFNNAGSYKKSQMVINYIDIPMELRIHSRKKDHKRAFYLAIGGKIGFRFAGKTKVVYSEFGTTKKYKNLYHYNVNAIRYGATARIGYGPINFWGYLGLNDFFTGNKTVGMKNPNTFSFGLSLSTF